jgi:hypothetical protein
VDCPAKAYVTKVAIFKESQFHVIIFGEICFLVVTHSQQVDGENSREKKRIKYQLETCIMQRSTLDVEVLFYVKLPPQGAHKGHKFDEVSAF